MASVLTIGLGFVAQDYYDGSLLAGIAAYRDAHHLPWRFRFLPTSLPDADSATWAAAILHAQSPVGAEVVAHLPPVVVNVTSSPVDQFPRVAASRHLGRIACDHLWERGYRSFALCVPRDDRSGAPQRASFEEAVSERGRSCVTCAVPLVAGSPPGAWDELLRLAGWLRTLALPAGVWALRDGVAMELSRAAELAGLRVPLDIGILGLNNEEAICEISSPPTSSVILPLGKMGWEAAALADRLLRGEPPPNGPVFVPSPGVRVRASTDVLAIHDPVVSRAVQFIREHAARPLRAAEVIAAAAASRRSLERRFRDAMGCTVLEQIRLEHVRRAQLLLTGTDLSLDRVAERSGFATTPHFASVFREATGTTPGQYRRQFRRSGDGGAP